MVLSLPRNHAGRRSLTEIQASIMAASTPEDSDSGIDAWSSGLSEQLLSQEYTAMDTDDCEPVRTQLLEYIASTNRRRPYLKLLLVGSHLKNALAV